jgi:hypothetical protein
MADRLISPSVRPAVIAVVTVAGILAAGIWINLLTDEHAEPGDPSFLDAAANLGWTNLLLLAAIVCAVIQVVLPIVVRRRASSTYNKLASPTLNNILALTSKSVRALAPDTKVNGRFFYAENESGRDVLARADEIHFEADEMPAEFGLDKVYVDSDDLVICRSFKTGDPIYEVLPSDHMNRYDERIKSKIDPKQSWVLACPVFASERAKGRTRLGVVCLYGKEAPAEQGAAEVDRLKAVAIDLSKAFAGTLQGFETLRSAE